MGLLLLLVQTPPLVDTGFSPLPHSTLSLMGRSPFLGYPVGQRRTLSSFREVMITNAVTRWQYCLLHCPNYYSSQSRELRDRGEGTYDWVRKTPWKWYALCDLTVGLIRCASIRTYKTVSLRFLTSSLAAQLEQTLFPPNWKMKSGGRIRTVSLWFHVSMKWCHCHYRIQFSSTQHT